MAKRVIIVHGWGGSPKDEMLSWLRQELEKNNFEVIVPEMPHTDEPTINNWVDHLTHVVGTADKDTYFIGHSIGCQTIMRYLEKLPENINVGGVVFIAGWITLKGIEEEDMSIAKPWLETPIDFEKVKQNTDNFVAIFSDDDPFVPLKDKDIFSEKLHAKIIVEHKKGHFTGETNVIDNSVVLEAILSMS